MRIAYVIINANRREGTSRAVVEVAERLSECHQVDIWARNISDVDANRINLRPLPGPTKPSVLELATFASACDRALGREKYDIVHSAGVNTHAADVYTVQTVQSCKRKAMRQVASNSGASLMRRVSRRLYDQRVIRGEKACYRPYGPRGVKGFAPVAVGVRDELLSEYAVGDAEVAVIPNAADTRLFSPEPRQDSRIELGRRHGLDVQDFLLIFSGGEWRRKGLDIAIRALALIPDCRVKLLVAGRDPVAHELEQLPARLGIQDRVVFAGFRDDIHRYYAGGDLFVFPSAYEAFSVASIEAASSGLPVLMPHVSGADELLGSGEAGQIVVRTPDAFAAAIQDLVGDPLKLSQLRAGARQTVETQFTWDRVAQLTESFYERLLERRFKEAARSDAAPHRNGH